MYIFSKHSDEKVNMDSKIDIIKQERKELVLDSFILGTALRKMTEGLNEMIASIDLPPKERNKTDDAQNIARFVFNYSFGA